MALTAATFAQLSSKEMCKCMQLQNRTSNPACVTIYVWVSASFVFYELGAHTESIEPIQFKKIRSHGMTNSYVIFFCVVEVFDNDRDHMKQELLVPDDEFSTIQTTSFIKMPASVLKAW